MVNQELSNTAKGTLNARLAEFTDRLNPEDRTQFRYSALLRVPSYLRENLLRLSLGLDADALRLAKIGILPLLDRANKEDIAWDQLAISKGPDKAVSKSEQIDPDQIRLYQKLTQNRTSGSDYAIDLLLRSNPEIFTGATDWSREGNQLVVKRGDKPTDYYRYFLSGDAFLVISPGKSSKPYVSEKVANIEDIFETEISEGRNKLSQILLRSGGLPQKMKNIVSYLAQTPFAMNYGDPNITISAEGRDSLSLNKQNSTTYIYIGQASSEELGISLVDFHDTRFEIRGTISISDPDNPRLLSPEEAKKLLRLCALKRNSAELNDLELQLVDAFIRGNESRYYLLQSPQLSVSKDEKNIALKTEGSIITYSILPGKNADSITINYGVGENPTVEVALREPAEIRAELNEQATPRARTAEFFSRLIEDQLKRDRLPRIFYDLQSDFIDSDMNDKISFADQLMKLTPYETKLNLIDDPFIENNEAKDKLFSKLKFPSNDEILDLIKK